jgi:DNA-directed RNA polymerase specialized sigma subunit
MNSQGMATTCDLDQLANDEILHILHKAAQPLSTIQGILELTLSKDMTAKEIKEWLEKAAQQIMQANSTFRQLRVVVEKQAVWCSEGRAQNV